MDDLHCTAGHRRVTFVVIIPSETGDQPVAASSRCCAVGGPNGSGGSDSRLRAAGAPHGTEDSLATPALSRFGDDVCGFAGLGNPELDKFAMAQLYRFRILRNLGNGDQFRGGAVKICASLSVVDASHGYSCQSGAHHCDPSRELRRSCGRSHGGLLGMRQARRFVTPFRDETSR